MREIKFRVWDKVNNSWFDNDFLLFTNSAVYKNFRDFEDGLWLRDFEYEISQYTGLKDKSGVEIYEHDILLDHWGEMLLVGFGNHLTSTDYYASEAYGWFGEQISNSENTFSLGNGGEVIGNIYENPELLNTTK